MSETRAQFVYGFTVAMAMVLGVLIGVMVSHEPRRDDLPKQFEARFATMEQDCRTLMKRQQFILRRLDTDWNPATD